MPRILAAASLTCAFALPAAFPQAATAPTPLSAEALFRAAPLGEAELSPDGRHIGTIITDEHDTKNFLVFDLKNFKPAGLRGGGEFEISTFRWLSNDRVVFSVAKEKLYSWGLYAGDIDRLRSYTPIDQLDGTQIIGIPRSRSGRVIVWIRQSSRDEGRPGDLVELDAGGHTRTFAEARAGGALMKTYRPPREGTVMNWAPNRDGELGLCMTWLNGRTRLYHYLRASDSWAPVPLALGTRWMALDPDERYLWIVTHSPWAGYELRRMDIASGIAAPPVLTDPTYDMSTGRLFFSEKDKSLAGITYTKREHVSVWFSKSFASAQAIIDRKRPNTANVLVGNDSAERKFLFILSGPQHPGSYELLDLDARSLNVLADSAPWLKERALCPVQPISYTARDGLRLEGYLALPEGASREHRVPLVVLAHGGPWVRDADDYNPEVQFLASRGYAVLQPNYRGSAGYSPEVSDASAYQYEKMGDDVTDATRAIIASGVVDPARIAIMGGSFGGYLAVCGVTFESGLYRCAITECGVFDWESFIKSKSDVARPGEYELLTDEVGKPGRDNKYLERISPLEHADRIHVPVLIAHGTEDNVVDVAQSKRLAKVLKAHGVPCETFYRGVEGHGFFNYKNRVEFYHRVEAFLAANLGGATLTPVK
jgi:dipeptidyl aminopeptidase/acylaminoacyl peptidase